MAGMERASFRLLGGARSEQWEHVLQQSSPRSVSAQNGVMLSCFVCVHQAKRLVLTSGSRGKPAVRAVPAESAVVCLAMRRRWSFV